MVKGVGIVNQALVEAFQILKQVPTAGRAWGRGRGRDAILQLQAVSCDLSLIPIPQFQESRQGSLCNQAIMLITDGAVEDYEPVFETYNWPDRKVTDSCWKTRERGALLMPREHSPESL